MKIDCTLSVRENCSEDKYYQEKCKNLSPCPSSLNGSPGPWLPKLNYRKVMEYRSTIKYYPAQHLLLSSVTTVQKSKIEEENAEDRWWRSGQWQRTCLGRMQFIWWSRDSGYVCSSWRGLRIYCYPSLSLLSSRTILFLLSFNIQLEIKIKDPAGQTSLPGEGKWLGVVSSIGGSGWRRN